MEPLTPTGRVILALIRRGKTTGYEIKQLVDVSTRFFWAASYGQIYPELRRLEEAGLVEGTHEPQGGRQRRSYSLTPDGEAALDGWLRSTSELTYELRDEGLLKLFFSDELPPTARLNLLRRMRRRHEQVVAQLSQVEPGAREAGGGPYQVLRFGLDHHRWIVNWCLDQEKELEETWSSGSRT
jgi:DNA-binding PadR family transcriptional regulator